MRTVNAILFLTMFLVCSTTRSTSQIRGEVVDTSGAKISRTTIRVLDEKSRDLVLTARTGADGRFDLHDLPPGRYLIAVSSVGFSPALIEADTEKTGADAFRTIKLNILDCDAPDVNCDTFSTEPIPAPHPVVFRKQVTLGHAEGIDLDKGISLPSASPEANLSFTDKEGGIFLTPLHGAALLSSCRPEYGRRRSKTQVAEVRVDGLDPNSQICMRSIRGRFSKIFLTGVVRSDDQQITAYIVTLDK
jgi:hypothetical protein